MEPLAFLAFFTNSMRKFA